MATQSAGLLWQLINNHYKATTAELHFLQGTAVNLNGHQMQQEQQR